MTTTRLRLAVMWVGVRKTRFLLRTIGFASTIRLMRAMPSFYPSREGPDPRWVLEIRRVSGSPYHGTCLDRSLLLWFVLLQHGLDGDLRIGVARSEDGSGIDAHAWVEFDGLVLNDAPDVATRFAVFDEDPTGLVFQ